MLIYKIYSTEKFCIAYKSSNDAWKCLNNDAKVNGNEISDITNHFTNFAVLFGDNLPIDVGNESDSTSPSGGIFGITVLQFSFIIVAILALLAVITAIAILLYKRRREQSKEEFDLRHDSEIASVKVGESSSSFQL